MGEKAFDMNELYIGRIFVSKKAALHKVYAWVLAIYIAFASLSSKGHLLLFGALGVLTLIWLFFEDITIKKCRYISCYALFGCMAVLSMFNSQSKSNSLTFLAGYVAFFGVCILMSNISIEFVGYFMKCLFIVMGIFAVLTFIQAFSPEIVDKICAMLLDDSALEQNRNFVSAGDVYGGLPGITAQTGINAFYMAIFAGMCLIRVLSKREYRAVYVIGLMLGVFDLIKTNKRGMLIFFCMMAFILILLHYRKHFAKAVILCVVIGCIGLAVLLFTDVGQRILQKFISAGLSGRETLWKNALIEFAEHPILGMGIDSYATKYGMDAHNIYLQVLCETGIVGFIAFMAFVVFNFVSALKCCCIEYENNNMKMIAYFIVFMQGIFLLWGLSGNTLYDQMTLCSYMIAVGACNAFKLAIKENKHESRNLDVCQNK